MRYRSSLWITVAIVSGACGGSTPPALGAPGSARAQPAPDRTAAESHPGHGGRLFDKWYAAIDADFVPDDPKTEALDGKGGPFGNGTLPDASGQPLANPGHDYRLKNLLGWDLRGQQGIYGPAYMNRRNVLLPSVLTDTDTRAQWIQRLSEGDDAIPAYGKVLGEADIAALVDFLLNVRDGHLPQPDELYALSHEAPKSYTLSPLGDPARGHALFTQTCARCHGADGTKISIEDGEHSLGTLSRHNGYEVAMKILNGQPGTSMDAQVAGSREEQAAAIRDLLAALCDRQRYPRGDAKAEDVPDGDLRCAQALR